MRSAPKVKRVLQVSRPPDRRHRYGLRDTTMDGDRIRKPHAMQWLVPQRIGDATHHRRARSSPFTTQQGRRPQHGLVCRHQAYQLTARRSEAKRAV